MERLGLSDDELCEVLAVDPIAVMTGELAHRPELQILLDLTAEAAEQVGDGVLRRWLRRRGPDGVPFEHLRGARLRRLRGRPRGARRARLRPAAADARATRTFVQRRAAFTPCRTLAGAPRSTARGAGRPYSISGRFSPGQMPVSH